MRMRTEGEGGWYLGVIPTGGVLIVGEPGERTGGLKSGLERCVNEGKIFDEGGV
jgi:hypothetical protein